MQNILKSCFCSIAKLCQTLWNPVDWSIPGFPVLHHLLELAQNHVYGVVDAIQPSHFLLLSTLPSIRIFFDESVVCIRWPKYWNFSFSISPSNEYLGLISFRIDCIDLLAVQGTLKSLLQHHNSKVSIFLCSAFFLFQLSHLYRTTGKVIALTLNSSNHLPPEWSNIPFIRMHDFWKRN